MKAWIKRVYVRWVVKRCSGVLPCGSLGRAYFLKYGVDPTRIHYSPYEPDYELIWNLPKDKIAATRDRFELTPGRRRIVFSGRLAHVKRVDLLVDGFAAIAADRPEWDLVIVGDGPLREKLMARVPEQLGERVRWLGFIDDQEVVSAVYRNCDLLVLPSDYEPWALVINEAAAAGLAVVASDAVGAAAELVRDGVNGSVFPAGRLQVLTEKLRFATGPDRIEKLKAGSSTVLEEWRRTADPVQGLREALHDARQMPKF
jgi:glycosyltransferase involved in cell wall biosynthesis